MRSAKVQFNIPPKMHAILRGKAELIGTDVNDYARSLVVATVMAKADKRPPGRPKAEKPPPEPELVVVETEYSRGRDLCILINPPKDSPPIWEDVEVGGGGEKYYQNGFPIWSDEGQSFLEEWVRDHNRKNRLARSMPR